MDAGEPFALQTAKKSWMVTNDRPQELTNALSKNTIADPYDVPFSHTT